MLTDGGGVPDGADTGKKCVLPYLRERRIDHLALAVLSHPHPDHALGLISTLREVRADRLWLAAGTRGGELSRAATGQMPAGAVEDIEVGHPPFLLGDAVLEVLGPPRD